MLTNAYSRYKIFHNIERAIGYMCVLCMSLVLRVCVLWIRVYWMSLWIFNPIVNVRVSFSQSYLPSSRLFSARASDTKEINSKQKKTNHFKWGYTRVCCRTSKQKRTNRKKETRSITEKNTELYRVEIFFHTNFKLTMWLDAYKFTPRLFDSIKNANGKFH